MSDFRVVIPARHASTRLPGKPLRVIAGKLLVEHVYHAAMRSGAAEVVVATDDVRVLTACEARDINVRMTSDEHRSGTDRCAEVARALEWPADTIVVNVQGDEPLIEPESIARVAAALAASSADLSTLAAPITSAEDFASPNIVKVVCAADGSALYFSRASVPFQRDATAGREPWRNALHHVGLYAYSVGTLERVTGLAPCALEKIEALEQLRSLHHGLRIAVDVIDRAPGPGVDTEEDLARVEALLGGRG